MKKIIILVLALSLILCAQFSAFAVPCEENAENIVYGNDGCYYIELDSDNTDAAVYSNVDLSAEETIASNRVVGYDEEYVHEIDGGVLIDDPNYVADGCYFIIYEDDDCCDDMIEISAIKPGDTVAEPNGSNPPTSTEWDLDRTYSGSFSNLTARTYTNVYFKPATGGVGGTYYVRVRCKGTRENIQYNIGNYCVDCKLALTTTVSYKTPTANTYSSWHKFAFYVASSHSGHRIAPFVTNVDGTSSIAGDIEANRDGWN